MHDSTSAAVQVVDLVKRYATGAARGGRSTTRTAVAGATFTAAAGEVTAVLGPNGAGKTSTIECCEGLRHPDGGTVRVLDRDPARDGGWLRSRVGVMLQDGGMPGAARAGDVLELAAAMYANPRDPAALADRLDLTPHLRTPVRRLSGGQRQRLALAVAVVGRPRVAFLDEPTAGLDPQARVVVHELVHELRADGVAVVLTTHLLDEAERLADRLVLMAEGRVIATGSPLEVTGGDGVTLSFDAVRDLDLTELCGALRAGVTASEVRPGRYLVAAGADSTPLAPEDVATVTAWFARRGLMPEGMVLGRRSLEDVFLQIAARRRPALVGRP